MALAAAAARKTRRHELATGRFILLHDPDGSAVWDGNFRIVTYIRAQLEAEMGNDEMLGSVAWTWLVEALENHQAALPQRRRHRHAHPLGELRNPRRPARTPSTSSCAPPGRPPRPTSQAHLEAWSDMVCTFAGLPPLPDGVSALPNRRRN